MNALYVSLLVAIVAVLAISVNSASLQGPQSDCPDICTFDYRPVCGYDGECYHVYGNECSLKSDHCKNKKDLKAVEMKMCDEALAKSNPEVTLCKVDES